MINIRKLNDVGWGSGRERQFAVFGEKEDGEWKFEKSLSSLFSVINYVLFFQRANSISTFFSAADVFMYSSKAVTAAFSVCIMKPKMRTPAK